MPAAAATPPTRKLRRVLRVNSRRASDAGCTFALVSLMRGLLDVYDFESTHHTAEIVPAGPHHLCHMHQEKQNVSASEQEVLPPRRLISAEQRRQPAELHRFPNGKARYHGARAHQNNARVRD